jgi:hypothetical protein
MLQPMDSHPVSLGIKHRLEPKTRYMLLSESCGALSLMSGYVCHLQLLLALASSHSWVQVPHNLWPYFTVSDSRFTQPEGLTSQSQSYFMTGSLLPISLSWQQAPWDLKPEFLFSNWTLAVNSPYVTSSLTREWVRHLQLLLGLVNAVILRFESRRTHNHILLSRIRDSPNLEGQDPVFISPRIRVDQLYPQSLGSFFITSYESQGYGGGIRPRLHTGLVAILSRVELYR